VCLFNFISLHAYNSVCMHTKTDWGVHGFKNRLGGGVSTLVAAELYACRQAGNPMCGVRVLQLGFGDLVHGSLDG
jgi:hypothetical protein